MAKMAAGGSFTGQNWGGVSSYSNPNPPYDLITVNSFTPPPGSHGDTNDTIVFQGTTGLFMGVPISTPDYGPASSTYTAVLNGSPTVHDTVVTNVSNASSVVGGITYGATNLPASFTFSLAGTYTSTVQTILDAQQVTINGSGTFTTPSLSVSGQVTVSGGTLHGDITVIDDVIPSSFFAGLGFGGVATVPILGTTLTITGSNSVFAAPSFVEVGVTNNGPASLVLTAGATGTVGAIYLGVNGQGTEGDVTINAATLTSTSFIDVGFGANSTGKVSILSQGQLTTTNAAIGYGNDALGSVTLNGHGAKWTINGFGVVGYDGADVTDTLSVQNGATVTSQSYLAIGGNVDPTNGNLTGNGNLSISSGGTVISGTTVGTATLAAAVGFGPNSSGAVLIDGTGSLWDIKSRLDVGFSSGSTGTITVQNGGALQVEGDIIRLGSVPNSTGTLTFDAAGGATPSFTFTGGSNSQLLIGDAGTGRFIVKGGAQITTGADVIIGNQANSMGDATVQDAESSWTINGNLTVGLNGSGSLTIGDGATVTVSQASTLSQNQGSSGTLTVEGTGKLVNDINGGVSGPAFIHIDNSDMLLGLQGDVAMEVGGSGATLISVKQGGTIVTSGMPIIFGVQDQAR